MNEFRMLITVQPSDFGSRFLIDFARYLTDFAIVFFFAHQMFHKKKHSDMAASLCAVGGASLFAFAAAVFVWDFSQSLGMLFNCVILIFTIVALQFIYKDKLFYKIAYVLLYITFSTAVDIFLMALLLSFGVGWDAYFLEADKRGTFVLLFCVTQRILVLTAAALLYYAMRRFSAEVYRRYWSVLNYIALIMFWFVQLFGVFTAGMTNSTPQLLFAINVLLGVGIIAATLAMLNALPKIAKLLRADKPYENASFENAPEDGSGLSSREIQKLRHDVKNNIATISALIDSGDKAEAKRLLDELGARLGSALSSENKTGVTAVDAVVSQKAKCCEELSIVLNIHAEPLPETKITPIDLSSVISNILDNAIEAAQRCEAPEITLRIFKYKSYLAIICENPTDIVPLVVNGRLVSAKKDGGHGYGVEIISEICKNNNGRFQYEFDNKTFKASAFLEL